MQSNSNPVAKTPLKSSNNPQTMDSASKCVAVQPVEDQQEEEEQPFIKVTSKRGRKTFPHAPQVLRISGSGILGAPESEQIDEVLVKRQLSEAQLDLTQSRFYRSTLDLLQAHQSGPPSEIVCFGIGRFADCHIARYQLAFILALHQDLHTARIQFHEPVLRTGEERILLNLHCDIQLDNVEGKHRIATATNLHTLVFLPHCPKQLTNNFLWANWNRTALAHCSLLCNSFRQLSDSTPQRFLAIDAAYIQRLLPHTREHSLPANFRYTDVFNDTALHTFDVATAAIFEANPVQPVYPPDGSELITAQLSRIDL